MRVFPNADTGLTVIRGEVAYCWPISAVDAIAICAARQYGDAATARAIDALLGAVTGVQVANARELEARADPRVMPFNYSKLRINTRNYL
jgi:hypothetical protein